MINFSTDTPAKLDRSGVPSTVAVLFGLYPGTEVWRDGEEVVISCELGTSNYPADWTQWGTEFRIALGDVERGRTEYDPIACWSYSRIVFAAATEAKRRRDLGVAAGKEEAYVRKTEAVAKKEEPQHERSRPDNEGNAFANAERRPTIHLRDYQSRGVAELSQAIRDGHRRVLLVGPTGMGKMVLAGFLMQGSTAKGNGSIFVADQRELVDQCRDKLSKFGVDCSVLMAGSDQYTEDAIAWVASKDTLHARAFRSERCTPPKAKILVGDEAHKHLAQTWLDVMRYYSETQKSILVGLTATPCRMDGKGLGDLYDKLIQVATYKELRDAGWIVPCKVYAPTKPDLKGVAVARGDYVKAQLEGRVNTQKLVGDVVADWRKRADGRLTFCFGSGVQHSVHIRNQFRRHGISADHIDSKNVSASERDDIMGRFKDGTTTILCNYGIATTGVDVPEAACVISCRPTKSFSLWRQMCGRGLRSAPGKTDLLVLDHSGAVFIHGFPDEDVEWDLSTTEQAYKKKKENNDGKPCRACGTKYKGPACPNCGDVPPPVEPYECPACSAVFKGPECPQCGQKKALRSKGVEMEAGELKEVERAKLNKKDDRDTKLKEWKKAVGVAMNRKASMGMAFNIYKQKYGVSPPPDFDLMPKGKAQWKMNAHDFYELYQNFKAFGKDV